MEYILTNPYQNPTWKIVGGQRTFIGTGSGPRDTIEPRYRTITPVPSEHFPVYKLAGGVQTGPWLGTVERGLGWEQSAVLEANDAGDWLYSARAVELDGVGDYVNIGNKGTLPQAVAKIQYQARRGTVSSQPWFRLNSGVDLAGANLVRPGVWEDGEIVLATPTANLSEVWLGRSGAGYFNGALANVRFLAADGEVLARYLLNEHPAGLVNTLPALDSSGNGYHGSYVGGTSVAGIGVGADFRGLSEYGDYMWFSGAGAHIGFPSIGLNSANPVDVEFTMFCTRNPSHVALPFSHVSGAVFYLYWINPFTMALAVGGISSGVNYLTFSATFPLNKLCHMRFEYRPNTSNWVKAYADGVMIGQSTTSLSAPVFTSLTGSRFGFNTSDGVTHFQGFISDYTVNGTLIAEGNGTTSAAWGGGTVSGNPATIASYRRTPPQIGRGDWNNHPPSVIMDPMGLVGRWEFEDNLLDSSGNGNHGTGAFGTTTFAKGKIEQASVYDGSNAVRVAQTNSALLDSMLPASGFTVALWIKVTANHSGYALWAAVGATNGQSSQKFSVHSSYEDLRLNVSGQHYIISGFPQNEWRHIVLIGIVGQPTRFYQSGLLINTGSDGGTRGADNMAFGARSANVGFTAADVLFRGQIDDVQIWNRALAPHEIWALAGNFTPSQLADPTLDAIDNPIAVPRPTSTAFHSPHTSLFLRTDQTQVRALSFWFYHSGLSRTLFSNVNLTIGLTDNGTVTTTAGTIHQPLATTLGWNLVHINLPSVTDLTDFRSSDSMVDGLLVYDRVLSEPEILRNYNHVRSTYQ